MVAIARSPLAPAGFPAMPPVRGVQIGTAEAGLRYKGRPDLLFCLFAPGTGVAGLFTRSAMPAAPVEWCRRALAQGARAGGARARALVVNAGNANAFTGKAGDAAVRETVRAAQRLAGGRQREIFVASTGVIGEIPRKNAVAAKLPACSRALAEDGFAAAADAIRTTDTFPKGATREAVIDGEPYVVNGIAKGSGMIGPDMATMLAFLFTDAAIPAPVLGAIIADANARTFNAITVDSDTSTNDTLLAFATGEGPKHRPVSRPGDPRLADFRDKAEAVMLDLAQQIVRDGEGASKLMTVRVTGAASAEAARRIALAVANSPLVKTAVAGEDANWGRIVMAVGKSGERANRDRLVIAIGDEVVTRGGAVRRGYREARAAAHLKGREIEISIDVGAGRGAATAYGCDLGHGYISINADYRS